LLTLFSVTRKLSAFKVVRTGQAVIDALQASPYRDIDVAPRRSALPVRAVNL
jgi:hypothetical protein